MKGRIITRPDFDGVVCAVLLKKVLGLNTPVYWVQPNEIQNGRVQVGPEDVIANLPLHGKCALWFDHHVSNEINQPHEGLFRIAPSAAGLVYEYFRDKLGDHFEILVRQADKIDDAQLTLDEILHPERHPYILLSMAISVKNESDLAFCDHTVELLQNSAIDMVLADPKVKRRCDWVVAENRAYEALLVKHTHVQGAVSITDFRNVESVRHGNRFLVYSLFPKTVVNIKIFFEGDNTVVKVGHSILNRACHINVGQLLATYGGGGHRGAGACRLNREKSDIYIKEILDVLVRNEPQPE